MASNTELIREIVDRKHDVFKPGKDGFLFIGREELGTRYFTLRCMMMLDCFIKEYQRLLESKTREPMKQRPEAKFGMVLQEVKRGVEVARFKDRDDSLLRYNGYYACESSVPGYLPFYDNDDPCMASPAHLLNFFFRRMYGAVEEILHLQNAAQAFHRIIPFENTCEAKLQMIDRAFDTVLADLRESKTFRDSDHPIACGMKVEILNNASLQRSKDVIKDVMMAKLLPSDFKYVPALSAETLPPYEITSLLFHVTVLGENAFLGYLLDPQKTEYNRFHFTLDSIRDYYDDMFEEDCEEEGFE